MPYVRNSILQRTITFDSYYSHLQNVPFNFSMTPAEILNLLKSPAASSGDSATSGSSASSTFDFLLLLLLPVPLASALRFFVCFLSPVLSDELSDVVSCSATSDFRFFFFFDFSVALPFKELPFSKESDFSFFFLSVFVFFDGVLSTLLTTSIDSDKLWSGLVLLSPDFLFFVFFS